MNSNSKEVNSINENVNSINENMNPFKCFECNMDFKTDTEYKKHFEKNHPNLSARNLQVKMNNPYKCGHCKCTFKLFLGSYTYCL